MKRNYKNLNGFTIAEMLVTTFIIGVLSTILVVNWRENEKNYLVQQVAQEIAQNIRKAQGMALSGKNYQAQTIYSFGVFFDKNNEISYKIFADKNNNNTYQPSDLLIEDVILDPYIVINSLSSGNQDLNIVFSVPDGFTTFNPSATSATIIIKRKGTTCPSKTCRDIIIKNTGQVTIQ
ncbi:MAG: prepilin-type N-terminal cleavage/methylation domain-containing protein [Patescibacteria group bacterium]